MTTDHTLTISLYSCLISVDGVESMYGCGSLSYCCHEQGREFFYRAVQWEDVCGVPGRGTSNFLLGGSIGQPSQSVYYDAS